MEFWQSSSDEPPSESLPPPPPPPQFWLQQPPPPPPSQPLYSHSDFSAQTTTRAPCRLPPGFRLGNDYLSLGIGNNAEYIGQEIGRPSENFEMLNSVHQQVKRHPENETRKSGCSNPGFGLGYDFLSQGIGHSVELNQGIGRANGNFEMLNSVHSRIQRDPEKDSTKISAGCTSPGFQFGCFGQGTGDAYGNADMFSKVDPDIQRAIEKQKIREEIIAAEMARRQELEAEVREELRMERELALRMKGGDKFDRVHIPMDIWGKSLMPQVEGLSLEEKAEMMSVEESLSTQGRIETIEMDKLLFQPMNLESKANETDQEQEKTIFLAKPSADSPTYMEALVRPTKNGYTVFGNWGVGNIDGKTVWRCFLCQVSANSETAIKQHFNGSKHRSKRDTFRAEKNAAALKQAEEKAIHLSRGEPLLALPTNCLNGNGSSVLPNKAKGKEKFAYWCEMCSAGANNWYMMEAHKKGKRHLSLLQKKLPFWCDVCNVGAERAHIMQSHLNGKKHLNMLKEKAASM